MSTVYDLLFADQDLEEVLLGVELPEDSPLYAARARLWEGDVVGASHLGAGTQPPWSSFLEILARQRQGKSAERTLRALAEDPANEARVRLWAWRALRQSGVQPDAFALSELLGVVVEVPIGPGTDVLAVYCDGGQRYINHAGSLTARGGSPSSQEAQDLLTQAFPLLKLPTEERKREEVRPDRVRITALGADGLHVVNATPEELEEGGAYFDLLSAAVKVLQKLVP
ncbi:MAG: hypothetical protein KIT72_06325 [Polyangiaceae bacterium]|nr:hypothetical protein [Polyangiaceae bacterium]MCW5790017.1 hypothetical protein [Polyangiaceae bacterium]